MICFRTNLVNRGKRARSKTKSAPFAPLIPCGIFRLSIAPNTSVAHSTVTGNNGTGFLAKSTFPHVANLGQDVNANGGLGPAAPRHGAQAGQKDISRIPIVVAAVQITRNIRQRDHPSSYFHIGK